MILQHIPGNELRELDPPIGARELAAKRQEKVFKREPKTMFAPIYVENSGLLFSDIWPNYSHSTVKNCSDPLRCSRSGLSQEALIDHDCQSDPVSNHQYRSPMGSKEPNTLTFLAWATTGLLLVVALYTADLRCATRPISEILVAKAATFADSNGGLTSLFTGLGFRAPRNNVNTEAVLRRHNLILCTCRSA